MNTNGRRPEGWTSADAAGLAILPGLVRYDEVYDPGVAEIRHAFRVTVRVDQRPRVPGVARRRLQPGRAAHGRAAAAQGDARTSRASPPEVQKIFRAMKRYGLIVADNGSDMYIGGTFDTRWDNDILNPAFGALTASDFEVVRLGWQPGADPVVSLSSLGVNPATVAGSQPSTGTVTLSGPAPAGGVVVTLASTKPASARVPASVTIGAGLVAASFAVTTSAVAVSTAVDLRASYNGSTEVATLTVMPPPPTVTSLRLSPSTVVGGSTSTGTVTLSRAAPPGGVVVAIGSSKPAVAGAPATVAVAAGQVSASFAISTTAVAAGTSAVISASYNGGVPKTAPLTVTLPATTSLTLSPSTVVGGASVSGMVTLSRTRSAGRDRRDAHQLAPSPGRRAAQRDGRGGTAVSDLQRDDGARDDGYHGLDLGHLPRSDEGRDARDQALTRSAPPRRGYTAATSPNTRRKFPPSTLTTSSRERPRASSAAPIVGQSP